MNFYKLILISSVLFSIVAITNINAQGKHETRHMHRCMERLDLNDSQKEMINELRLNHKAEMIKLQSELELKQLDLDKLKSSKNFSSSGYINAVKEISAVKSKIAEARAEHRMDVYELLDDNQKQDFLSFPEQDGRNRMYRHYRQKDM